MTDPLSLIRKYYPEDNELRRILLTHSESVARKALDVAERHPELALDRVSVRLVTDETDASDDEGGL